jgi:hypothetical protein
MTDLRFDHLVIGAASLAQGVDWVEAELGVTLPPGGTHPRMGTHNRLTAVGPASFLEIIAVDPAAEPPPRPRWLPSRPRGPAGSPWTIWPSAPAWNRVPGC